jgi:diguanylate cyclase (GGDEF)-like protein
VVTEFLLLRRVLWRFVAGHLTGLERGDVIEVERRINDTIDRLVVECVVAYFDRATAELADQARRDPLTGLLNHQAFSDVLGLEVERGRRYGHGLTIVFFDLDRFKQINDTRGHEAGDELLLLVARRLERSVRAGDAVARFGGDEFVVICEEVAGRDEAMQIAGRIRESLAHTYRLSSGEASVAASVGIAMEDGQETVDDLLRDADMAAYRAKELGRNRIELAHREVAGMGTYPSQSTARSSR